MIKNLYHKGIKKSFLLNIFCGQCKEDFAVYQKVGRGNVLRMYVPRIIECAVDLKPLPNRLVCPNCGQHIADKIALKEKSAIAYRMRRSSYNTKEMHQSLFHLNGTGVLIFHERLLYWGLKAIKKEGF